MSNLFYKLLTVIITLLLTAMALLAVRQQRFLVAARITQEYKHLQMAEQQVWNLQSQVAERTSPEKIRELALKFDLTRYRDVPEDTEYLPAEAPDLNSAKNHNPSDNNRFVANADPHRGTDQPRIMPVVQADIAPDVNQQP